MQNTSDTSAIQVSHDTISDEKEQVGHDTIEKDPESDRKTPLAYVNDKEKKQLILQMFHARKNMEEKKDLSPAPESNTESKDVKLGEGAFGYVYKATWRGQTVAVKVSRLGLENANETESYFLSCLPRHPNIVPIYAEWKGGLVMEYLPGGSLYNYLKYHSISIGRCIKWMLDLSNGLSCIHNENILHRDLHLGNILISLDGTLKICDFGLSSHLNSSLDNGGAVFLTTKAPELSKGKPYSKASDVYSLGVCFQMITDKVENKQSIVSDFRFSTYDACKSDNPSDRPKVEEVFEQLIKLASQYPCEEWPPHSKPNPNEVNSSMSPSERPQQHGRASSVASLLFDQAESKLSGSRPSFLFNDYVVEGSNNYNLSPKQGNSMETLFINSLSNGNPDRKWLILGDVTTETPRASYQLMKAVLEERKRDENFNYLPIHIPLSFSISESDICKGIRSLLHEVNNLEWTQTVNLQEQKETNLIFFIDGFDEINVSNWKDYHTYSMNPFKMFKNLDEFPRCVVVITCRKNITTASDRVCEVSALDPHPRVLHLQPLTAQNVNKELEEKFSNSKGEEDNIIENLRGDQNLCEVLRMPIFLRRFCVFPSEFRKKYESKYGEKRPAASLYSVYHFFLQTWFKEESAKRHVRMLLTHMFGIKKENIDEVFCETIHIFCEYFVMYMLKRERNTPGINKKYGLKPLEKGYDEWKNKIIPFVRYELKKSSYEIKLTDVSSDNVSVETITAFLNSTPLVWKNESYSFLHHSFCDYFVAMYLMRSARNCVKNIGSKQTLESKTENPLEGVELADESILSHVTSVWGDLSALSNTENTYKPSSRLWNSHPQIFFFARDHLFEGRFLDNSDESSLRERLGLWALVLRSQADDEDKKSNEMKRIAASHAITLLCASEENLTDRDLHNISIPFASLRRANLTGSILKESDLSSVDLSQANMSRVDLYCSTVQNIKRPIVIRAGCCSSICFSSDGHRIVFRTEDGKICERNSLSGKELSWWEVETCRAAEQLDMMSSATLMYRIDSSNKTLLIRNDKTGQSTKLTLPRNLEGKTSFLFSPSGHRIASYSQDGTIFLWDSENGKLLQCLKGHEKGVTSVCFSPNGSRIVSGSLDGTVRIWDTSTGHIMLLLRGHTEPISSVVYSPDPDVSRIASSSRDGTVCIWSSVSGRELNRPERCITSNTSSSSSNASSSSSNASSSSSNASSSSSSSSSSTSSSSSSSHPFSSSTTSSSNAFSSFNTQVSDRYDDDRCQWPSWFQSWIIKVLWRKVLKNLLKLYGKLLSRLLLLGFEGLVKLDKFLTSLSTPEPQESQH